MTFESDISKLTATYKYNIAYKYIMLYMSKSYYV